MAEQAAPLRVAFWGSGFMGQAVHLPLLAAHAGCTVVALASSRPGIGRRLAARHGVPAVYGSISELLAAVPVDAVAVSLPGERSLELLPAACAAGKPVFAEKPLALNSAESLACVHAAERSGSRLMVGYMKRYDPASEVARGLLEEWRASGELGAVVSARAWNHHGDWIAGYPRDLFSDPSEPKPAGVSFGEYGVPPWVQPALGKTYAGCIANLCHNVNLLRHLLGEPTAVESTVATIGDFPYNPPMTAVLAYDGFHAVFSAGKVDSEPWCEGVQVLFERGYLELHLAAPLLRAPGRVVVKRPGRGVEEAVVPPGWSFARQIDHFVTHAASGAPFRSSGADAARDLVVFEAIFQSLQDRARIAISA